MRHTFRMLFIFCAAVVSLSGAQRERVVGGPCEGCDAVFDGLPPTVPAIGRLAPAGEPGTPLTLDGIVTSSTGAPVPGVVVYAYQTDAQGVYPAEPNLRGAAARHGRLRGWSRTDAAGRYQFETVRPGGYPNTDIPQHIHLHVIEPGRCTYYIDDVVFEDDPRLTPRQRAAHDRGRGGSGIVTPSQTQNRAWRATRHIRLGAGIGGYSACGQ